METKEKELKNLKEAAVEDANDLRKLYSLAQERIGERNIGNLAIKKLKLERASVTKASFTPLKVNNHQQQCQFLSQLGGERNKGSSIQAI
uniref:Uncharacterized protein n=1 Tax=Salix viminalis TaxID=40686 RepID=A0A6N2K7J5_SALVM